MGESTPISPFDVATAFQYLYGGDEALAQLSPDSCAALAAAVGRDWSVYALVARAEGVPDDMVWPLWCWFHPDEADSDEYHDLRRCPPSDPPRA